MTAGTDPPAKPTVDDLYQQLDELEDTVDTQAELKEVHDVRLTLERLPGRERFGKRIERYTTRDVAESFVGAIVLSLPLLVEDGVYDIADHFLAHTVAGVPVWLVANAAFIVLMTWGLLYWADFRELQGSEPFFGILPRRLVGVMCISFLTATMLMTIWGRVENWSEPSVAIARISVIWAAAAFGAALGDMLPGESRGTELREVPREVSDTLRSDD